MKKYLTIIASAALLAACSNEADLVDNGQPTGKAIAFNMALAGTGDATRAANEIKDDAALRAIEFGVFSAYTGHLRYEQTSVSCDFMYNQRVKYNSGKWTYEPVKYWSNDSLDYFSFYAYAPYAEKLATDAEGGIVDMSKNYELGDPWINFRLPSRPWATATQESNQIDLLYMQHRTGAGTTADPYKYTPWDDQRAPHKVDSVMSFNFLHALACVGDTVRIRLSDELYNTTNGYCTFKLDSIAIIYKNLTTKARLVLRTKDGVANWKEIISGELTTTRTFEKKFDTPIDITNKAFSEADTKILEGSGLFYIPFQIRGTDAAYAEVVITYTVNNGVNSYQGEATGQFELDNNLEGKKQSINVTLGGDLSLNHLVLQLLTPATEPSYSRKNK